MKEIVSVSESWVIDPISGNDINIYPPPPKIASSHVLHSLYMLIIPGTENSNKSLSATMAVFPTDLHRLFHKPGLGSSF